MIWLWICIAVAITVMVSRKDKIELQYYIWALLPIEMYGISVAGATIKPYMIAGLLLMLYLLQAERKLIFPKSFLIITLALLLSNCLNGMVMASLMQHIMFILVLYIAYVFVRVCNYKISIRQLQAISVATLIGYGIAFCLAYLYMVMGGESLQVLSLDRHSPGVFLRFLSTGGAETIRLRGFCIDPNILITIPLVGALFALNNLLVVHRERGKSIAAIGLFFAIVVLSGSRMATLCSFVMCLIMVIHGYRQSHNKSRVIIGGIYVLIILILLQAFGIVDFLGSISEYIVDIFDDRAGLTDDEGRFTIWKNNLEYLFENQKMWFGVGQNQIAKLTDYGKDCHNTWLEWICGTGLFVGLTIDIWFLSVPFTSLRKIKKDNPVRIYQIVLVAAYCITILCITSVDNITNSALIFLMAILRYGELQEDDSPKALNKA